MRRFPLTVAAAIILASVISYAQSGQSVPLLENETSNLWFVELSSPPSVEGTSVSTLEREETNFHRAAASAGLRYSKGRHFRKLWNGLTVRASALEVPKLRALPGVLAVSPVRKVHLSQSESPEGPGADLVTAIKMTGVDVAQSELGLTGRGVKVAVIDTGIDYDHPDLGGCFGRGCRVEKGFDLVGDAFNANDTMASFNPVPTPDPLPDDCNGHGTHVAGIIGANGAIKGVAPAVKFHAYRVFGCEGSTSTDIMIAAMEMALDGGADVVNMSIGSALQWPQEPSAQAANRLVRHGITVVASSGNEGTLGLYAASAPGIAKDVIGVASFENTHANLVAFTISPDAAKIGYVEAAGAPPAPRTGSFPLVRTGTATTTNDACAALAAGSLTGKVALIRRGTCGFAIKAANAQAAGAAGVVLYNNAAGLLSATVVGAVPITIPVVGITAANGVLIDGRLATGSVDMTWTSLVTGELQTTGGLISSFSSYGPAADLSFKPDLGAPGGSIRSTLPLEQGGSGNLSGTSMAAPHVAGAVALLLEARPHARPEEVQRRLQNTGRPAPWWGAPALGFLDNVHRQGAGMLRIDDAIEADTTVSPSSLTIGEIESGSAWRFLKIAKADSHDRPWWGWGFGWERKRGRWHHPKDDDQVTYTLGHEPALATGPNTFTPAFLDAFADVEFASPSVTLGGWRHRDEAYVLVKITPPPLADARLIGGYITLTPDDGGPVLRVPYTAYNGDYQAIVALSPTPFGFPWLAKVVGPNLVNQPLGASFTLQGDDSPFILFHLDHQVRTLKLEVVDVSTGRSIGFVDHEQFVPRNSSATSFFAFVWDGTASRWPGAPPKPVPNGTYRIDLSALKALGDWWNPAHTERWSSPEIGIIRP